MGGGTGMLEGVLIVALPVGADDIVVATLSFTHEVERLRTAFDERCGSWRALPGRK